MSKKSNRNSIEDIGIDFATIICLALFFIMSMIVVRTITHFHESNPSKQFETIETEDYRIRAFEYKKAANKIPKSVLVDEKLRGFDLTSMDVDFDEVHYIKSKKELEDFCRFVKTDRSKLMVLIDETSEELIEQMEILDGFESLYDIKGKVQIYNFGNKKSTHAAVYVDETLGIPPIDIAYWNIGIHPEPEKTCIIDGSSDFSLDYKYNIYVIVSVDNDELLDFCNSISN